MPNSFETPCFSSTPRGVSLGLKAYRFSFNGKENDNEVKGDGSQQDYGMRIYDPRLGRFLSVDPITAKYPELSPYQFSTNNPIQNIDVDGLEGESALMIIAERFEGYSIVINTVTGESMVNRTEIQSTEFHEASSTLVINYTTTSYKINEKGTLVSASTTSSSASIQIEKMTITPDRVHIEKQKGETVKENIFLPKMQDKLVNAWAGLVKSDPEAVKGGDVPFRTFDDKFTAVLTTLTKKSLSIASKALGPFGSLITTGVGEFEKINKPESIVLERIELNDKEKAAEVLTKETKN